MPWILETLDIKFHQRKRKVLKFVEVQIGSQILLQDRLTRKKIAGYQIHHLRGQSLHKNTEHQDQGLLKTCLNHMARGQHLQEENQDLLEEGLNHQYGGLPLQEGNQGHQGEDQGHQNINEGL